MFVKRFKRKCSVRGCKNTSDVFVISKNREMGNTIALCRDCMKEALSATENYVEPIKTIKESKPLFPHPELDVVMPSDEKPGHNEGENETSDMTTEEAESVDEISEKEPTPEKTQRKKKSGR